MKHTKGKWGVDQGEFGLDINNGEGTIGTIYGDDIETKANANLIAAAPELLEALKNAKNCLRNHCENRGSDESKLSGWELDAYEIVKSAINKAEGK